jgi:hypothetical protein
MLAQFWLHPPPSLSFSPSFSPLPPSILSFSPSPLPPPSSLSLPPLLPFSPFSSLLGRGGGGSCLPHHPSLHGFSLTAVSPSPVSPSPPLPSLSSPTSSPPLPQGQDGFIPGVSEIHTQELAAKIGETERLHMKVSSEYEVRVETLCKMCHVLT